MDKIRNTLVPAYRFVVIGVLLSFLVLTVLLAGGHPLKQGFPIIGVVLYTILSLVVDKVSYVRERVWMKPLILLGVAVVLLLLLIL